MRRQIVCAGTGGQGVILLARILGEAGRREGLEVFSAEAHGLAVRGGPVLAMVKLGGFASPVILAGRADLLMGLDRAEADRNRHYLRPGGTAVVNTAGAPARNAWEIDALSLARRSGSVQSLNILMAGFAAGLGLLGVAPGNLLAAVAALSPPGDRSANLAAFDLGLVVAGSGTPWPGSAPV